MIEEPGFFKDDDWRKWTFVPFQPTPDFICPFCEREIHGFDFCPYCHSEFANREKAAYRDLHYARAKFWERWIGRAKEFASRIIQQP